MADVRRDPSMTTSLLRLTVSRWRARRVELARQSALISRRSAELDTELAQLEYDHFCSGRPSTRAVASFRTRGLRHLDAMRDARDGQRAWPASELAAATPSARAARTWTQMLGEILEPLAFAFLLGGAFAAFQGGTVGIVLLVAAPLVFCTGVCCAFSPRFERA
jgi:hypothetical protein